MQMKSFREAIGGFAEPSAIAGRERVEGEWGEYELDEEADDSEDPPRPNTFLARAVAEATTEEEGDRGDVGQPYSPQFQANPEAELDLLGDRTGAVTRERDGREKETFGLLSLFLSCVLGGSRNRDGMQPLCSGGTTSRGGKQGKPLPPCGSETSRGVPLL
ncbi:hypothetical protein Taro_005314 [Colocasia esculenta]|uniref:Uncharacterized protein n=1 Tax=Colocasia esculenta TaxID=4460 RepID=A0A843TU83_COLES|nr:hypothetical protein [Colocasia esculenta]